MTDLEMGASDMGSINVEMDVVKRDSPDQEDYPGFEGGNRR